MQLQYQLYQIQPQSAAAAAAVARLLHAVEGREERFQRLGRNVCAVVFHAQRIGRKPYAYRRVLRGVEQRIHQYVVQRVGQQIGIAAQLHIGLDVGGEPECALRDQLLNAFQLRRKQRAQVDHFIF